MILNSDIALQRLKSVKDCCGKVPIGERRSAAWKHYHAAEVAHTAQDSKKNGHRDQRSEPVARSMTKNDQRLAA